MGHRQHFQQAVQPYVLGDAFTVADSHLYVMLFWAKAKAGVDVPPNLDAYCGRLSGHEAVRKALADEGLL